MKIVRNDDDTTKKNIIIPAFLILFIICSVVHTITRMSQPSEPVKNEPKLVLENSAVTHYDLPLSTGHTGRVIVGTVFNQSDEKFSVVQVMFSLYDGVGTRVGTASATIQELEPDRKWKFKASAFGQDWVRYKLSNLSGTVAK